MSAVAPSIVDTTKQAFSEASESTTSSASSPFTHGQVNGTSIPEKPQIRIPFIKDQRIQNLLLWRNWQRSAGFLGFCTMLYFVIELSGWPLYTMVAYSLIILIVGFFLWSNAAARIEGSLKPEHFLPAFFKTGLTKEDFEKFADQHLEEVNTVINHVYLIVAGKSPQLSVKVIGSLVSVGYASSLVSPVSGTYFILLALFTIPKLYEMNKEEVDAFLAEHKDKINSLLSQVDSNLLDKIPRAQTAKKTAAQKAE